MHPCSPHAPAGVFTSSSPLWTARSRRRTDVGARRHDTPLPGTLSPFPSFCFSRNSRARKQRVLELFALLFRAHLWRLRRPLVHPCPRALSHPLTHFSQASRRQQRLYPRSRFGLRRSTSASHRAPALGRWVCPCPPQLLAVRRPSRASHPPRSRRRPRMASSQRIRPARVLLLWLPRPQHRRHHAACCLPNKKLAHTCASSPLRARVLVLCACECKFECECDCTWNNLRPAVP